MYKFMYLLYNNYSLELGSFYVYKVEFSEIGGKLEAFELFHTYSYHT